MTIVANALITLNLSVSPLLVDLILKRNLKKQTVYFHISRYVFLAFLYNVFNICLFSFYKNNSAGNSLLYLIGKLNIKYIAAATVISIFYVMIFNRIKIFLKFDLICQKHLIFSLLFALFFINASLRFNEMYKDVPLDQLIFHIKFPVAGANFFMITNFLVPLIIDTIVMVFIITLILSIKVKIKTKTICFPIRLIKKAVPPLAILLPLIGIVTLVIVLGVPKYLNVLDSRPSTVYEDHYIDPANIDITFPEKKRNLIVVFVESLETGFLKIENGGSFYEDLVPEIGYLAEENINFSQNDGIGGVVQLNGTGWTIAGIVSQYSGVPLMLPLVEGNSYGLLGEEFIPGAYGIGDVLNKAGYKNYFILGSEAEFGGRDKYFKTHGDATIYDYRYFHDNNFISKDYKVWWGFEDRKLYQFAKEKLLEISSDSPFFLTLLTVDTHPVDGYLDNEAEKTFGSQYENVLRNMSRLLYDFVLWLKDQDFFENTTVVILGDHLYMDSSVFQEDYVKETDRRFPINIFINSLLDDTKVKNRVFSSFDIFPALVDSIGATYNSDGLALGRSMNKGASTLLEYLGVDSFQNSISKKSYFYNTLWGTQNNMLSSLPKNQLTMR
jgi:phosphoglycerol transferase